MSGTLPKWLEAWLVKTGPGEGTQWEFKTSGAWSWWAAALLLAVAAVFMAMVYRRESGRAVPLLRLFLGTLRFTLVGVLLLMILQWTLVLKRTRLPYLAVVIDDSQSMTIADRYDAKQRAALEDRVERAKLDESGLNRWNLVRALLTEDDGALLDELAENYQPRVYFLSELQALEESDTAGLCAEIRAHEATGASTRLGDAVQTVLGKLRGAPPAAIVLLTDGINTDGTPLGKADNRGVPLYCVGIGSDAPLKNLELIGLQPPDEVSVNRIVPFSFTVKSVGFQGTTAAVTLREKGSPRVLARTEVVVGPDGTSQSDSLPYSPPEIGRFDYVVEIEPQEGELRTDDNRRTCTVEVGKQELRVLLAQEYPSYEFRFLRNLLSNDKTVKLTTVLQDADPEYVKSYEGDRTDPRREERVTNVFPVAREELLAYHAIILGDLDPARLDKATLQTLADYVDRPGKGGVLICITGPKYMPLAYRNTPLARVLPIKDWNTVVAPLAGKLLREGFQARPTEDFGLQSPPLQLGDTPAQTRDIWRNLPPLYWLLEVPDLKPGARVLVENAARQGRDGRHLPVVCMQYVGAGKVLLQTTDETHRWRWRTGDGLIRRYWIQMLYFLYRSKPGEGDLPAALTSDQPEYQRGETVRLRLKFADEDKAPATAQGLKVVVEQHGKQVQELWLQQPAGSRATFEGLLQNLPPGTYHARVITPLGDGGSPATDFTVKPPVGEFDRVQMDKAALEDAARRTKGGYYTFETARQLPADLPPGNQQPYETRPPVPLWNSHALLLLFLTLLIGEWVLRKAGGMV